MKISIASLGATKRVLHAFNLRASKRLGQNFLIDADIVRAIVATAELAPGDAVLEIGPGLGTLTQGLLDAGASVTAVELDKKLPAVLAETLNGYGDINLITGDVLKLDLREVMRGAPFKVVANLPYYLTTPILLTLLERRLPITRIVAMVQREVAERMVAQPGGKDYGAVTVAMQYFTQPAIALTVPPRAFYPRPQVTSAVMRCDVRTAPPVDVADEATCFALVKSAFAQRRKTLANSLLAYGLPKAAIATALATAGIDPQRRAETLSLADFARLTRAVIATRS